MATKMWAIFLVAFCSVLSAIAQPIFKQGVNQINQQNVFSAAVWLGVGLFIYGVNALLLIIALKGGELSVLYPIIATGFIWVNLSAFFIFGEPLNFWKWIGIFSIILGVSFMGVGGRK